MSIPLQATTIHDLPGSQRFGPSYEIAVRFGVVLFSKIVEPNLASQFDPREQSVRLDAE
jgi:hypothetical protein